MLLGDVRLATCVSSNLQAEPVSSFSSGAWPLGPCIDQFTACRKHAVTVTAHDCGLRVQVSTALHQALILTLPADRDLSVGLLPNPLQAKWL